MTFTASELAAIQEAAPAYRAAYERLTDPEQKGKSRQKLRFMFETADEILRRHGIEHTTSFTGEHRRYGQIERAVRRLAMAETLTDSREAA